MIVEEFDISRSCRAQKRIIILYIMDRQGRNSHNAAYALACICTGTSSDLLGAAHRREETRTEWTTPMS